jgi:hypothetical protein
MTQQEELNWKEYVKANLFVAKEFFHHHAYEILDTHSELRDNLKACLNKEIKIKPRIKNTKGLKNRAIKADFLNVEIRNLLKNETKEDYKFEVNEDSGIFYFSAGKSSIGGFDFAVLNHKANLVALRNLCFGELHYHDGITRWTKFLEKNPDLEEFAKTLNTSDNFGSNIDYKEKDTDTPLIVGEIQFGNWALVYRDFFKVLKANVQNSIDCLVYVVPTGNLESLLSDGIVTFDKTKKIIEDFAKVISVPVWVIGIDLD